MAAALAVAFKPSTDVFHWASSWYTSLKLAVCLSPHQVLQKIMADPELAMAFSNPKVQTAVMDVSSNPMNIVNYQNDPDVMKVCACYPLACYTLACCLTLLPNQAAACT